MSKLRIFRNRNLLILVPIISSLLLVILACGGDDGDTASDSSAAAPVAQATATTAAAKPAKAAEVKAPAAADGPSGSLTAALKHVGVPIGTPHLLSRILHQTRSALQPLVLPRRPDRCSRVL